VRQSAARAFCRDEPDDDRPHPGIYIGTNIDTETTFSIQASATPTLVLARNARYDIICL
jgi:hypothetical protein